MYALCSTVVTYSGKEHFRRRKRQLKKLRDILETLQSELFCSCLPRSLEWNPQVFGTAHGGDPILVSQP